MMISMKLKTFIWRNSFWPIHWVRLEEAFDTFEENDEDGELEGEYCIEEIESQAVIPLLSEAVPEVHTVNGNEESKTVIHTVNESLAPETVIHTVNNNEESETVSHTVNES